MLCAANIMSRRVVFCCGAFRAKLRSFRGRERERDRERKREGKAPTKFVSFFPLISSLSLFFSQTLNTWDIFFLKAREEKKSCHGWTTTRYNRVRKEKSEETKRKVDATTTCRDDPSSLEKKRGGEKTQGKEEGEEHEKARE